MNYPGPDLLNILFRSLFAGAGAAEFAQAVREKRAASVDTSPEMTGNRIGQGDESHRADQADQAPTRPKSSTISTGVATELELVTPPARKRAVSDGSLIRAGEKGKGLQRPSIRKKLTKRLKTWWKKSKGKRSRSQSDTSETAMVVQEARPSWLSRHKPASLKSRKKKASKLAELQGSDDDEEEIEGIRVSAETEAIRNASARRWSARIKYALIIVMVRD